MTRDLDKSRARTGELNIDQIKDLISRRNREGPSGRDSAAERGAVAPD